MLTVVEWGHSHLTCEEYPEYYEDEVCRFKKRKAEGEKEKGI